MAAHALAPLAGGVDPTPIEVRTPLVRSIDSYHSADAE